MDCSARGRRSHAVPRHRLSRPLLSLQHRRCPPPHRVCGAALRRRVGFAAGAETRLGWFLCVSVCRVKICISCLIAGLLGGMVCAPRTLPADVWNWARALSAPGPHWPQLGAGSAACPDVGIFLDFPVWIHRVRPYAGSPRAGRDGYHASSAAESDSPGESPPATWSTPPSHRLPLRMSRSSLESCHGRHHPCWRRMLAPQWCSQCV